MTLHLAPAPWSLPAVQNFFSARRLKFVKSKCLVRTLKLKFYLCLIDTVVIVRRLAGKKSRPPGKPDLKGKN
jgi:hypothetical protein